MKMRTLKYFTREGIKNVNRNKVMSFASISSVIAALLVIGIFFCIMINISYLANTLEAQVEMVVEISNDLSPDLIASMKKSILSVHDVKEVTFVSKAEALENMKKAMGDNKDVLSGLEADNPLPDSFKVNLKNANSADDIAFNIKSISNVVNVTYGKDELKKLLKLIYVIRLSSLMIIAVLIFISIFIISNTIKLTVYARRKEIGIMKYVGATDTFVRGPFLVEGMLLGFVGGLIAALILMPGYMSLDNFIKNQMFGLFKVSILPMSQIAFNLTTLLMTVGIIIGAIGSMISVRRFIKV